MTPVINTITSVTSGQRYQPRRNPSQQICRPQDAPRWKINMLKQFLILHLTQVKAKIFLKHHLILYLTKILWLGYYRESRRLELQWGRHTYIAMKLYFWKSAKETTKTQNRITTSTAFYCVGKSGRRRQWSRGENDQKGEVEISKPKYSILFQFTKLLTPSPPASTSGPVDSKDLPVDSFFSAGDPSDKKRLKWKLTMSPIFQEANFI